MNDFKVQYNESFTSQAEVDQFVIETEKLAEQVKDQESAIELYENISYLKSAMDIYFVPDVVLDWEKMALSHIESKAALFEQVHYDRISQMHQSGFDAFANLEEAVLNNGMPEEMLFNLIHTFNMDIEKFNGYCRKYGKDTFSYYQCANDDLRQKYDMWLGC